MPLIGVLLMGAAMLLVGPNAKSSNVRFIAALGGRADIRQAAEIDALDPTRTCRHVAPTAEGTPGHSAGITWGRNRARKDIGVDAASIPGLSFSLAENVILFDIQNVRPALER